MANYTFIRLDIPKATACAFHDKVHGTHKRKSVFKKFTDGTLIILTFFISQTIESF